MQKRPRVCANPISACAGYFPGICDVPRPRGDVRLPLRNTGKKRRMRPTHATDAPLLRRQVEPGRVDGEYLYL